MGQGSPDPNASGSKGGGGGAALRDGEGLAAGAARSGQGSAKGSRRTQGKAGSSQGAKRSAKGQGRGRAGAAYYDGASEDPGPDDVQYLAIDDRSAGPVGIDGRKKKGGDEFDSVVGADPGGGAEGNEEETPGEQWPDANGLLPPIPDEEYKEDDPTWVGKLSYNKVKIWQH